MLSHLGASIRFGDTSGASERFAGPISVVARACSLPDLRFDAELIEKSWLKNLKNKRSTRPRVIKTISELQPPRWLWCLNQEKPSQTVQTVQNRRQHWLMSLSQT